MQCLGQGSLLAKIDIKEAYRIVLVHPQDKPLLGFQCQGNVYVDGTLPFGLCSTPKIFNTIIDLLNWILNDHCRTCIIHYHDDFFIIGPPTLPPLLPCNTEIPSDLCFAGRPNRPQEGGRPNTVSYILRRGDRYSTVGRSPPHRQALTNP